MRSYRTLIHPRPNVRLDAFEASQREMPDDPLAPARGCFIHGPWMGLVLWVIGIGLLWWWLWA